MDKKVSLTSLKYNPVRKKLGDIIIYNLDTEMKLELLKLIENNITQDNQVQINGKDVLVKLLPLLTNITLPQEQEKIDEILKNPGEVLEEVVEEISEMITKFLNQVVKNIDKLEEMNLEEGEMILEH